MSNRAKRRAKQYARAALRIEKAYYREIRKLYREWFAEYLAKLGSALGIRLDAEGDFGFLEALGEEAIRALKNKVQRFSFKMKDSAKKIANLKNIVWTKDKPVDLLVNPLISEPWLAVELSDFAGENAALITKMGRDTTDRISSVVLDNLKHGKGRTALKAEIKKIDKSIGENRAKLIARDQMGKLQNNLTKVRAERVGVEKYEWQTVGDNRVRPTHAKLDGSTREYGKGLEPGQDIGCRCVAIPVIEF